MMADMFSARGSSSTRVQTRAGIQATDRLPSYMLISFNPGNSRHVSVIVSTVTALNLSSPLSFKSICSDSF